MSTSTIRTLALAAVCAASLSPAAQAQTNPREELRSAVASRLQALLGDSSADVVRRLQQIRPTGAISSNFNLGRITQAAFTRGGGVAAPDCRVTTTPQREADEGLCTYEQGKRDDETGAYTQLSYSKNIGLGNVKFIKRAAFRPGDTADPPTVRLSDEDAYKKALEFAELLGLPRAEIPQAPTGARNPLPVRSLVVGAGQERGQGSRFEVQKVVTLPRAFVVPGGLYRDPFTGVVLNHVVAPGGATFAVTDAGVQFARVDGWSDAQFDPRLDADRAKTVAQLTTEITDDLYNEGVRKVGSLSVLIALRKAYPNPEDPNPPLCPVCGVLRPALQVLVSQLGGPRVATSERSYAAPGLVREYDLVDVVEAERAPR